MISDNLIKRYNIGSLEEYAEITGSKKQGEYVFYRSFLEQTDYVTNKLIEAQTLGEKIDQDYTEVLQARAYARQKLSELGVGT